MLDKYSGNSFNIGFYINDRVFTADSIIDFQLLLGFNNIPYGKVSLIINADPDFKINTGDYGYILFVGTDITSLDTSELSIYIINSALNGVSGKQTEFKIEFKFGTPKSLEPISYAYTGNSLDAIKESFTHNDYQCINILNENNMSNTNDNMVWKYISDNMESRATEIISHTIRQNDYVFWYFDENYASYAISSFQLSQEMGSRYAMIYNKNALSSTSASTYTDTNSGIKIWLYPNESRENLLGSKLKELYPNLVFSTISNGSVNVGNCKGDCFSNVMKSLGDNTQETLRTQMNISKNSTYGDVKLIQNYPSNTHKLYSLSPDIRERILATYGKVLYVSLYNSLGPEIGSLINVLTYKPNSLVEMPTIDPIYTDQYIVAEKAILQGRYLKSGLLNVPNRDETSDYIIKIKLISNHINDSGLEATLNVFKTIDIDNYSKAVL